MGSSILWRCQKHIWTLLVQVLEEVYLNQHRSSSWSNYSWPRGTVLAQQYCFQDLHAALHSAMHAELLISCISSLCTILQSLQGGILLRAAPCCNTEIQSVHFGGDLCPGSFYKLPMVHFQILRTTGVPKSCLPISQIGWSNKTYYCLLMEKDLGYEKQNQAKQSMHHIHIQFLFVTRLTQDAYLWWDPLRL